MILDSLINNLLSKYMFLCLLGTGLGGCSPLPAANEGRHVNYWRIAGCQIVSKEKLNGLMPVKGMDFWKDLMGRVMSLFITVQLTETGSAALKKENLLSFLWLKLTKDCKRRMLPR